MKAFRNSLVLLSAAICLFVLAVLPVKAAPQQMADGTMFDAEYYAAQNPDVVAVYGKSVKKLYSHYTKYGKNEGRLPVAPAGVDDFDPVFYAATYPDVAAAFGNDPAMLLMHYQLCGKNEGRLPSAAAAAIATADPSKTVITPPTASTTSAAPVVQSGMDISMLDSKYAAVQADCVLIGAGTGFHGKVVLQNPVSAVSFGIQYDQFGGQGYAGKTVYLCENVYSNAIGGQAYSRHGLGALATPTRLLLALDTSTGYLDMYVNGQWVGKTYNPYLMNGGLVAAVEGSARIGGDVVTTTFTNIKFKKAGSTNCTGDRVYLQQMASRNPGLSVGATGCAVDQWYQGSGAVVTISGSVFLLPGLDWDNAYQDVSGVAVFALHV